MFAAFRSASYLVLQYFTAAGRTRLAREARRWEEDRKKKKNTVFYLFILNIPPDDSLLLAWLPLGGFIFALAPGVRTRYDVPTTSIKSEHTCLSRWYRFYLFYRTAVVVEPGRRQEVGDDLLLRSYEVFLFRRIRPQTPKTHTHSYTAQPVVSRRTCCTSTAAVSSTAEWVITGLPSPC